MYSRVTLLEIDTVRVDLDDAVEQYETKVMPRMRELPGYEGVAVMVTPEGKGMIVSFWDSEEAVEADRRLRIQRARGVRHALPLAPRA